MRPVAVALPLRQAFDLRGEGGYEEPQWSQAGVERVVEQASGAGVQEALLQVVESAVRNGLYPQPWKRSNHEPNATTATHTPRQRQALELPRIPRPRAATPIILAAQ